MAFEVIRTDGVISPAVRIVVLSAVQFYGQVYCRAVEIQDIWANAVLAEEFQSMKLLVANLSPKSLFGLRLRFPQPPPAVFQVWVI
jgi:hypothetical protein